MCYSCKVNTNYSILRVRLVLMNAGFFNGTLTACCGGGGPYNFNNSARCGHTGSKACNDPCAHVNWDGIHLTEAAYRHIAKGLISGPFSTPPLVLSPLR